MQFISAQFAIFYFVFVALYHSVLVFLKTEKNIVLAQKILLLAASLFFYSFFDIRFLLVLVYVIIVTYLAGFFCKNKITFIVLLLADLAPLLVFKYGPKYYHADWVFPLGISFFTFQSLGYVFDVHNNKVQTERNILNVATFVSFFPTISVGPIQRFNSFISQYNQPHVFNYDDAADGVRLFAWGLFKKLMIADRIALFVNYVYGNVPEQRGLALLWATILYSFQIYCDFSACSDMAIGVARYIGFDVGKNFARPYLSQSVGEFWHRWHISLSSWLRDYVFIPLGGSRVALPRIYLNLVVTFFVSGIWHGSAWNFVIWGLLHGAFLCVERAVRPFIEKWGFPAWIKIAVTFCLVAFAWIFFRAENLSEALLVIKKIAGSFGELIQFVEMSKSDGVKNALHAMFSMVSDAGGAVKGMAITLSLLIAFCCAQILTKETGFAHWLKQRSLVIRWFVYLTFIVCFVELMLDNFINGQAFSTNFIYRAF